MLGREDLPGSEEKGQPHSLSRERTTGEGQECGEKGGIR